MTRFRFQSMPRNRGTTPGGEAANAIARCFVCGGCGPGGSLLSSRTHVERAIRMPRRRVDGNFEIARGYARSRSRSARGLTVLTGHSGITLVKVVPVLARVEPNDQRRRPRLIVAARLKSLSTVRMTSLVAWILRGGRNDQPHSMHRGGLCRRPNHGSDCEALS